MALAQVPTRARRVLELAGESLDPNARGGPDPVLAQELLCDALVFAAADSTAPATDDVGESRVEAAIARLTASGALSRAAGSTERAKEILTGLTATPPPADMPALELFVRQVVDATEGHDKTRRAARRRPWMYAGLIVLVVGALGAFEAARFPWRSYAFKASSAEAGFVAQGRLSQLQSYNLLFHTTTEDGPWVEIDLFETRTVSRIILRQRADCCKDRGLPMIVEVAGEDKAWVEVGERTVAFDKWDLRFTKPHEARWVRIRSTATTILHLSDIQIR